MRFLLTVHFFLVPIIFYLDCYLFFQKLLLFHYSCVFITILCFLHKKNGFFFIFYTFVLLYPLSIVVSFFFNLDYHYLAVTRLNYRSETVVLLHLLILISFISIGTRQLSISLNSRPPFLFPRNIGIFFVLIFFIAISCGLYTTPYKGLLDHSYNSSSSQLFDYSFIFFCLIMFSKLGKKNLIITLCIISYFIVTIWTGRRGSLIMAIFALMFLYLSNNPIKLRHIVYGTLFLLVMRTFSSYRAIGVVSIESVLGLGINDLALATHWGGVFVSNAICFDLIESVWSINFRFSSLIGMLTCYIPYSITPFKEIYLNVEALKITEIMVLAVFQHFFFMFRVVLLVSYFFQVFSFLCHILSEI